MSDFCVKCVEKDSEIELLRNRHFAEIQCMKQQIEELKSKNEALILDVAFYAGDFKHLTNNNN
jgi:hypothetical protein